MKDAPADDLSAAPLLAAGYFITRAVERSSHLSAELMPEQILSASDCLCPILPEIWAFDWAEVADDERREAAAAFGIDGEGLAAASRWVSERHEAGRVGFCNVFTGIEDAREFAATFLERGALPLVLVGIGLVQADAERLRTESAPAEGEGTPGVYACVAAGELLASGGTQLGYEPLCYDHGGFHSWLCNGLEVAAHDALGVRPNADGFIGDRDEARRVAAYCGSDAVGAEPGLWLAFSYTMYRF